MNIKNFNLTNIILSVVGIVGVIIVNNIINDKFNYGDNTVYKILIPIAVAILIALVELLILKLIKQFTTENINTILFSIGIVTILNIYDVLSFGHSTLYKIMILLILGILNGFVLVLITKSIHANK
ncbi:hypothetical protein KX935_03910 [Streptobacillus moniliformis]|nr:hypothetical protein KX935_03910 [Streptobacillus moniliformis]